jgi:hypothetical protein
MKKITILKKSQNSSLNFFLCKIKKRLKYFTRNSNSCLILKKKLFIYHNQFFFLPIFFDLLIFFRKSTNNPSPFVNFAQKKKKN